MKRGLIIFICGFSTIFLVAQPLKIQECWSLARDHYPLIGAKQSLITSTQLKIDNVKNIWLPQVEVSGQATLQSDVPHLDLSQTPNFPVSIPSAPKDQYKIALEVTQSIYDGGRTAEKSKLEKLGGEIEQMDIEVQLQQIRSVVTQLFFSIFILEAQKQQFTYMRDDLEVRIQEVVVAYESGVLLKSTLSSLRVEQLRLDQRIISVKSTQNQLLQSLSLFIGQTILSCDELTKPTMSDFIEPMARVEYKRFDLMHARADVGVKLYQRNRLPILATFGQVGYGNPGFNMLNDAFDTFWIVGVKLIWTPWDWKESNRAQKIAEHSKEMVSFQRESFNLHQKHQLIEVSGIAAQYLKMMDKDAEIIELQKEVTNDYRSQLKNGAITTSNYIIELNNEARARLDRELHELYYLQSLAQQQQIGVVDYVE